MIAVPGGYEAVAYDQRRHIDFWSDTGSWRQAAERMYPQDYGAGDDGSICGGPGVTVAGVLLPGSQHATFIVCGGFTGDGSGWDVVFTEGSDDWRYLVLRSRKLVPLVPAQHMRMAYFCRHALPAVRLRPLSTQVSLTLRSRAPSRSCRIGDGRVLNLRSPATAASRLVLCQRLLPRCGGYLQYLRATGRMARRFDRLASRPQPAGVLTLKWRSQLSLKLSVGTSRTILPEARRDVGRLSMLLPTPRSSSRSLHDKALATLPRQPGILPASRPAMAVGSI
jgi:hypothetical protein